MFILYSTLGCHLCDQALAVIRPQLASQSDIQIVDIADNDALFELYGVRIPVVKHESTGKEMGWPFGERELSDWMAAL
ncbi:MAG: glutaredoxin family protein [Agarilytica sp.]